MKLKDLKEKIDLAVEFAGETDPDVTIWVGDDTEYEIGRIGQFQIKPDVNIHVGEKVYESQERKEE